MPDFSVINKVYRNFKPCKNWLVGEIFKSLRINGTFFLRLHAPEYNSFSLENNLILNQLLIDVHEIGYNSKNIDPINIWDENATKCLSRAINILNFKLDAKIGAVARHNRHTRLNSLDFWGNKKAYDFGCLYKAYEVGEYFKLWNEAIYISESEITRWKFYNKGFSMKGDKESFEANLEMRLKLIYHLIYSNAYYTNHFYKKKYLR
ncbi:MAG: hypothetical protein CBB97_19295 [Candidatus Endolissoclinum sp. TMED37]|nr:MAG: hypothetical protein CBB97_19295 [Candidatus Endolissoclinum sp. TMED37]|tara:strand:- start:2742 stop:3359 length:618 start_codon:yes stop_codon:yes gene_type:complete